MEDKKSKEIKMMEPKEVAAGEIIYAYNCPKEMEEMKPVKETLVVDQSKISAGIAE